MLLLRSSGDGDQLEDRRASGRIRIGDGRRVVELGVHVAPAREQPGHDGRVVGEDDGRGQARLGERQRRHEAVADERDGVGRGVVGVGGPRGDFRHAGRADVVHDGLGLACARPARDGDDEAVVVVVRGFGRRRQGDVRRVARLRRAGDEERPAVEQAHEDVGVDGRVGARPRVHQHGRGRQRDLRGLQQRAGRLVLGDGHLDLDGRRGGRVDQVLGDG